MNIANKLWSIERHFSWREQPHGGSSLQSFDSLDEWFEKVSIQGVGENLQADRVPSSQFLSFEKGNL